MYELSVDYPEAIVNEKNFQNLPKLFLCKIWILLIEERSYGGEVESFSISPVLQQQKLPSIIYI